MRFGTPFILSNTDEFLVFYHIMFSILASMMFS